MKMATEHETLLIASRLIKLLLRFFDTNMTKEELRQEFRAMLKDWKPGGQTKWQPTQINKA